MRNVLSILAILLLLQGEAIAKGSGRSYSSGSSSSFGRASSSSSSSSHASGFGKSYASGGSRTYSSAGSSAPKSFSSPGSSAPKSYSSSGDGSKASLFGKSAATFPARTNSPGSAPTSATRSNSSTSHSVGGSKSYSSAGGNSFFGKSAVAPKGNFNTGLTAAGQREDSRIAYEKHYTTPVGTTKTYTPSDQAAAARVRSVDEYRYRNYNSRVQIFYGNSQPAYYNDYWSPFLMGYLFSSAVNSTDRTAWVYNHRDSIDDARYRDLLARDAGLEAQLNQLQTQNVQRDPNYVLPTMANEPDLMYDKGFVESARAHGPSVWSVAVETLLAVGVIGAAIWLFFIREW
jgi:hypothetical protein